MNLAQSINDPLFDLFWQKYPNKVAKIAAQKAWKKLAPNREDTVHILDALEKHKAQRMWQEGIGIPHPATYLNQARFAPFPPKLPLALPYKKAGDEEAFSPSPVISEK